MDYEDRMREKWGESILRNIIRTNDFAHPVEENIGELHKKIAKSKRANNYE